MKTLLSRRLLSIPAVLIFTVLFTANVMAETYTATTMRLLRCEGKVEIQDSSGKSSLVMENIRLNSGESLQTGAGSSASVGLDSAKIVTLDEKTKVEFTKQAKEMKLSLVEGSFLLDVSEKLNKDESLDIRTSTMAVGIRGTVVLVSTYPLDEYQKKLSQKMSDAQTSTAADTSLSDLEEKIMQSSDGGGVVSVLGVLEGKVELVYQDESGKSTKLEVSGGQKATLLDANENDMVDIKPEVDKVTYADIFSAADREIQNDPDLQKRLRDADFEIPDNSKVDPNYPANGDWTISSPVTVIAQSASKMFDGQPLTRTSDILVQGLPSGLTFRASAAGSQTDAGSGENLISSFAIYNQKGENVTGHFTNIQKVPGKLTVDPAPLTAWTASVTKVYDGKPLTSPETKLTFSPGYERNHARKNLSYVIAENGYTTGSRSTNNKSNKVSRTASGSKSAAYIKPAVYSSSAAGYRPATYNTPVKLSSSIASDSAVTGFKYVMSSGSAADSELVTGNEPGTGNKSVDGSGASSSAGQSSDFYDTQTLYGICGVVLVHGSNPITEEIKEINLSAGEKLTVHLSDENNEASIEYVIEKITEDEIPDEILRIYADNPDVLAQACTETGWSAEKVTERIDKLSPLEYKSSEVNGVKVDSRNTEDLMEDCTNVRITIDTEGTDYNDRALNEEEAHYTPMKADPSIRIVLNSSLTDVGTAQSTFTIDWGNANPGNYNLTMQPGTLTITPASATVTTGSAEKEYDGTPLTSSEASISGLVNNETATVVTTGSITDVGTADNTYTINWGTAKADNYTLTANVGTLKIIGSQTGITFKAPSDSKTYDGTPLEAGAVTVTGLPRGYTFAATASGSQTDAGSSETTVTSYKILDRDGKDVTASFTNIKTENGTLTVNRAVVTITTDSITKGYDGTPLNGTVSITGLADADKEKVTVTATASITDVGTTESTYTINWGTAKSSNYTLSENIGTLEVTKNNKEIIFTSASAEKVYDGKPLTAHTVTAAGLPEGFTYVASAGHTHAVTDAGTYKNYFDDMEYTSTNENGEMLVGWRYAVIKNADGKDVTDNFTNIKLIQGTLTINPLDIIFELNSYDAVFSGQKVLPDGITGTYGDGSEVDEESTTFEEDVFHLPIHLTSVFNLTGGGKVQIDCDGYSDAGNYEYAPEETFLDGNKNNYNISYTNTGVTIKPIDVRLTVSDGSCVFDGNYHAAELTDASCGDNVTSIESIADSEWRIYGYTVFINETINIKMEGGGGTDAGEYPLTYSYSFANNDPGNYNIIEPTVNKTVIKPLMLLIDLGNPHVTYNSETHGGSLNVNYENGPKTGETIEPYWTRENYNGILAYKYNVSPDADITVTAGNGGPDADTYTLSCITDFTTGNPDNYKISVTGNNLIIDPKTVPVETGSATEAYDASNPDKAVTNSTAAIHNLALNDKDRVTIMATGSQIEIGSSENTYSINWGGVNPNNYNIVEHLGTLTKTSPVTGLFGFRERLTNKLTESFGTAVDSNSDKQAGADSSAAKDPKAEDDRKPAANQSGDNTGSKTTGDLKTDKNDKTTTGNGKTADRTEESKKDEASSDAGKDESGKTESEKAEVTESEKSEEAEPEKTESSESGKTETTEVCKPEEEKPEEQKPEAQKPEEQKPEAQEPEAQKPEEQKPEEQKPEAQKPEDRPSTASAAVENH